MLFVSTRFCYIFYCLGSFCIIFDGFVTISGIPGMHFLHNLPVLGPLFSLTPITRSKMFMPQTKKILSCNLAVGLTSNLQIEL
jgi:hypothetical protein